MMANSNLFSLLISVSIMAIILILGSCQSESKVINSEEGALPDSIYIAYGQRIAGTSFQHLSGRLQAAMQTGGVNNAVETCQLAARPLLDSLSKEFNATIRRTALRVRNPNSTPSKQEQAVLQAYEQAKANGQTLQPQVVDQGNGEMAFYGPIMLATLCTKCHGTPGETIAEEDYALIKNLYPSDQAIGYQTGDLRGIWSISFAKNAVQQ